MLSPRSIASSFAPTGTVATAESVLSTGRGDRGDFIRGDFWDRLPAFEEPTPRGNEYYQAPLARTQTPSMAAMMQAASLSGTDEDAVKEQQVRSMLAQTGGTGGAKATPRGLEAKSFRDTQRNYREPADMEIRDVLHNVLDPAAGGETRCGVGCCLVLIWLSVQSGCLLLVLY